MRDLQGIAEINGPNRAALQAERAKNIFSNSHGLVGYQQRKHGDRVAARQAQAVPGQGNHGRTAQNIG